LGKKIIVTLDDDILSAMQLVTGKTNAAKAKSCITGFLNTQSFTKEMRRMTYKRETNKK